MDFLWKNRETLVVGVIGSLIAAGILAALRALLGAAASLGSVVAAIAPWLFIAVAALIFGSALAFAVAIVRPPPTLRNEVLRYTRAMRLYADKADKSRRLQPMPTSFWKHFPFTEYSGLQDRMALALGANSITPVSNFFPISTTVVRNIANVLESEALRIPEDMPL